MNKSKSRLFLIEMVVIILFFSIAAAVCVNMFAHAKMISVKSTELTEASMKAQEAAETFKSAGGDAGAVRDRLDAHADGEGIAVYYDGEWERTNAQPAYVLRMDFSKEDGLSRADISVYQNEEELYRIQTAVYGDGA